MKAEIRLRTVEDIKRFAYVVCSFDCDVNIGKGSVVYDAKSMLGVFALDSRNGAVVELISDDPSECERFVKAMEEFQ